MRVVSLTKTLILASVLLGGVAVQAQDPFEIQVYDSLTAEPGSPGLELHVNSSLRDSQSHATLEPHFGLTRLNELGGYLQTVLLPDGRYEYAGFKLRLKTAAPRLLNGQLGLAVNLEFSDVPRAFDPAGLGGELRPIVDFRKGRFYAALNPILSFELGGPRKFQPQLEPATKVAWSVSVPVSVGMEYYGAYGPLRAMEFTGPSAHRLFAALDYTARWFDVNLGVGDGFSARDRVLFKAVFGVHPPRAASSSTTGPRTDKQEPAR